MLEPRVATAPSKDFSDLILQPESTPSQVQTVITPGVCRYCGCTEDRPCVISYLEGNLVTCAWLDSERTICDDPNCVGEHVFQSMLEDHDLTAAAAIARVMTGRAQ